MTRRHTCREVAEQPLSTLAASTIFDATFQNEIRRLCRCRIRELEFFFAIGRGKGATGKNDKSKSKTVRSSARSSCSLGSFTLHRGLPLASRRSELLRRAPSLR